MARHALEKLLDRFEIDGGRGGVVGVADQDQPRGDGDLGLNRIEVVPGFGVQRHLDPPRPGGGGEVGIDAERGPRVDDLCPRLEQRFAGREQDVARAVAERDPLLADPIAVGQRPPQGRVGRVGVAVHAGEDPLSGLDDFRQRREARLVRRQHRHVGPEVVAGGDWVVRDAADPLGEFEGHRPIVPLRGPPAARGPPRGTRVWARDPRGRSNGAACGSRAAASREPGPRGHTAAARG